MIRFFAKQDKDQKDSNESRLEIVEWKLNVILAIVGVQLALTLFLVAKEFLMPSKTTIFVVLIALIAAAWFLRKYIPGLIKQALVTQIVGDDSQEKKSPKSQMEDSIR